MPTLVFDLDGTLVDSAQDLAAAASEVVQGFGGPPLDVATVVPMVGDGAPMLVQRALTHAGLDPKTPAALDRFLAIYDRRLLDHTQPYEGIPEMLAMMVHVGPLAVLTNKRVAITHTVTRVETRVRQTLRMRTQTLMSPRISIVRTSSPVRAAPSTGIRVRTPRAGTSFPTERKPRSGAAHEETILDVDFCCSTHLAGRQHGYPGD